MFKLLMSFVVLGKGARDLEAQSHCALLLSKGKMAKRQEERKDRARK
jgi:hypothetical protein